MKALILALLIGTICFLNGCKDVECEPLPSIDYCERYISCYMTPNALAMREFEDADPMCVNLSFSGDLIRSDEKAYDELSARYGDLSFNGYTQAIPRKAVNDSINRIEVKSVARFDAEHPAGSDVSEFVELQYVSYYDFIESGYGEVDKGELSEWGNLDKYHGLDGAAFHKKALPEIKASDTKLMETDFLLKFNKMPEDSGTYQFELVFHMGEKKICTTVECTF